MENSISGIFYFWNSRIVEKENCLLGEKWNWRHGEMESWILGDLEKWRHGDKSLYSSIETGNGSLEA